jgi:hypothetical protein
MTTRPTLPCPQRCPLCPLHVETSQFDPSAFGQQRTIQPEPTFWQIPSMTRMPHTNGRTPRTRRRAPPHKKIKSAPGDSLPKLSKHEAASPAVAARWGTMGEPASARRKALDAMREA